MAGRGKKRQFPTAHKIKAIERGEGVLPVARELGISRKSLHDWIKAWNADGPDGLNRKPGPKPGLRKLKQLATYDDKWANARIAELERLVGRHQMDLGFFSERLSGIGAAGSARQTRIRIIEVIQAMTSERTDANADIQRLCRLAGLPRATYYRHLNRHSREAAECELRDQLQRICLKYPFYGSYGDSARNRPSIAHRRSLTSRAQPRASGRTSVPSLARTMSSKAQHMAPRSSQSEISRA